MTPAETLNVIDSVLSVVWSLIGVAVMAAGYAGWALERALSARARRDHGDEIARHRDRIAHLRGLADRRLNRMAEMRRHISGLEADIERARRRRRGRRCAHRQEVRS